MKKVLVGGSIAYDNIMDFPGLFKDHILPEKIDSLNISFLVNSLKRMRGGTAPNISYNLALVGLNPVLLGTVGKDFAEYKAWLDENGVDTSFVRTLDDDYTASCFITTDNSNNQIIGFYPGAMSKDPEISLKNIDLTDIAMVVIAPTEPTAMMKWALECQELNVPYLIDAGMQLPRLSGEDIKKMLIGARIAVFNEYEYDVMLKKTGLSEEEILDKVELLIETLGKQGCTLRRGKEKVYVPEAKEERIVDPTGAGDAFRAGLLKGYFENASLEVIGRYANVTAVYAVEHKGATVHKYTLDEFNKRYNENYGGK